MAASHRRIHTSLRVDDDYGQYGCARKIAQFNMAAILVLQRRYPVGGCCVGNGGRTKDKHSDLAGYHRHIINHIAGQRQGGCTISFRI